MAQVSYPGVYIEEFAPAPPIQPAGTRVGAFVGAAAGGEIDKPTRITSFNQFLDTYGRRPINGFFLWYAVKGFFENGGTDCFVVRASNGRYANDVLTNGVKGVLKVRTREPGKPEPTIAVKAARTHRLAAEKTRIFAVQAEVAKAPGPDRFVELKSESGVPGSAFLFRPGDVILVTDTGARATIRQVDSRGNKIKLDRDVDGLGAGKTISLAPVQANEQTIRIEYLKSDGSGDDDILPPDALIPGTMLTLRPGDAESQRVTGIVDSVENEFLFVSIPGANPVDPPVSRKKVTYRVTFRDNLGKAFARDVGDDKRAVQSEEFDLTVQVGEQTPKTYNFLSMDPVHTRYAPKYVSDRGAESDALIKLEATDPPPPGDPTSLLPKDEASVTLGTGEETADRSPGKTENLADLFTQPNEFITALETLKTINDVNLVSVPDAVALSLASDRIAVQQAIIGHCENMGDRFGVLDPLRADQDPFQDVGDEKSIETQRGQLVSTRGYAALYYPWIRALPASRGPLVAVPPSGHVCGLMARVDNARGVHKAPANETLNGAVAITRNMSNEDQGILNLQGINVIRTFTENGRPIVFGARTTASDINWQYVNVRRLFLFLEKSISSSLRSSVFEPNNTELWSKLNRTITAFLLTQWRAGALFGAKAEEAFYVKIDETLNPFNERALGKLTIEVGVQPTYPAEFIVVRIGIWDGGAEVSE